MGSGAGRFVWILALPLADYMTLGELLNFSVPIFSHSNYSKTVARTKWDFMLNCRTRVPAKMQALSVCLLSLYFWSSIKPSFQVFFLIDGLDGILKPWEGWNALTCIRLCSSHSAAPFPHIIPLNISKAVQRYSCLHFSDVTQRVRARR